MKFNWLNDTANRKSKQRGKSLEYQRFEPRNLLAGDLGQFGNEAMLIEELANREDTAWTQKGLNDLVAVDSETDLDGTTTVFQQTWNGLPVFNAWVTVVQDANGDITHVRDHARQNIEGYAQDVEPIAESSALRIGSEGIKGALASNVDASMAWYFTGSKARLTWLVETSVVDDSGNLTEAYETWVDVFDGSLFHREAKGETVSEVLADPFTETGVFPRIVINDAIGSGGSRLYGANFNSVAFMDVGCTGTLIAPNVVISARHCGTISEVTFGDAFFLSTAKTYAVESVVFPGGGTAASPLLDGGDVSILTLAEDVPESVAIPMRFLDAADELEGMVAATVGYGLNGVGSSGHGGTLDGFRWAGENIIDTVGAPAGSTGSNIISTDFDDGSELANTIAGSDPTPLLLEATTAPGDSGGPILVDVDGEWVIAGVLSGGTTPDSVYGDISWWTGTSIYRDQIEDAGGVFVNSRSADGVIEIDSSSYFLGDTVTITVKDGNVVGDTVTVEVGSDTGDEETLVLTEVSDGRYQATIDTSGDALALNDGVLQVAAGDVIATLYVDVEDENGDQVNQEVFAVINAVPPPVIGVDFDTSDNAPINWLANIAQDGLFEDLGNEVGGGSTIDLTITTDSINSFDVALNADTIPVHVNPIDNVDGQMWTGALPVNFLYSDLDPNSTYDIYVMAAEGFFASIEQTVTIQGDGDAISFEQRFNFGDLFINDQLGDSGSVLSDYKIEVVPDSNGQISIDVEPIEGTSDVVLAGIAIVPPAFVPAAAPEIILNEAEIERSIVNEVVVSFDDIVTIGADAFELIKRGPDGGVVDVTASINNRGDSTVVTLSFAGDFATAAGSLVDGNYQLTVFGDQVIGSNGLEMDGDADGAAGGDLIFGDTEEDNFFRFFGDINGNRRVDVFDLLAFRQAWGSSDGDPAFESQFDNSGNGSIDVFDLLPFRNNYIDTLDFV